jgi:hypothetical protein
MSCKLLMSGEAHALLVGLLSWGALVGFAGLDDGTDTGRAVMTQNDSQPAEPRRPRVPKRFLPDIVGLSVTRIPFKPPESRFVRSVYADYKEALAFTVDLSDELRLDQDVTPVLYIGDVPVSHAEDLGKRRVRFLAFPDAERKMKPGAAIAIGWPGLPSQKRETKFRFQPPAGKK